MNEFIYWFFNMNHLAVLFTVLGFPFIIGQLWHSMNQAKKDRSFQLIDRYYTVYHPLELGYRGILPVQELIPPSLTSPDNAVFEREMLISRNRSYVKFFFREMGKYWIRNSIDKETINDHLGREIIYRFDKMRDEIIEARKTSPKYLSEWETMVNDLRNQKFQFDFFKWLYRDIHGQIDY